MGGCKGNGGDTLGKLAVLEISEPGDKIGEKLLMLLDARQQQELVKYLLSKEKQNGGSADNLCIRSKAYGLQMCIRDRFKMGQLLITDHLQMMQQL